MSNAKRTQRLHDCLTRLKSAEKTQQREAANDLARLLLPLAQKHAALLVRHYPGLPNSCLLADYIASEACWLALRSINTLLRPDTLTDWLRTIVWRQLANHFRQRRQEIPMDELPHLPYENEYSTALFTTDIWDVVSGLPDALRETVILYYWHDLSVTDCARLLGVGQPAISQRLKKARELIKNTLNSREGGQD